MSALPTETYPNSDTELGSKPVLRLVKDDVEYDAHTLEVLSNLAPDGYRADSYESEHVLILALNRQTGQYSEICFMGMCVTYHCVAVNGHTLYAEQWRDGVNYTAPALDQAACATLGALADLSWGLRQRWLFDEKVEHPDNWKG